MSSIRSLQALNQQPAVTKAVTLLAFIREMSCSNRDQDYSDRDLSRASSVPADKYLDITLKEATTTFFHIVPNSSFVDFTLIRRCAV